jgi:predicted nucleic acid-binding protein
MTKKARALVLDSWAILAYLGDEPSGEKIADLLADAHENDLPLLLSVVNAGEVWYILARQSTEAHADDALGILAQLGIELVPVDWELARAAARFKVKKQLSYADCFAAALALNRKGELATGDKEFEQVSADIKINWL